MYDNVKYIGQALTWWRDEVFCGIYSLGELYQMVKDGVKLERIKSK